MVVGAGQQPARSGTPEDQLRALATGEAGVLEALARMQVGSLERSRLDEETYLLARLVSYLAHLGRIGELPAAKVLATLAAVAPVVGSARVLSAASSLRAAGLLTT
jgi:4-carboxymuconolactone decarboxylase